MNLPGFNGAASLQSTRANYVEGGAFQIATGAVIPQAADQACIQQCLSDALFVCAQRPNPARCFIRESRNCFVVCS